MQQERGILSTKKNENDNDGETLYLNDTWKDKKHILPTKYSLKIQSRTKLKIKKHYQYYLFIRFRPFCLTEKTFTSCKNPLVLTWWYYLAGCKQVASH